MKILLQKASVVVPCMRCMSGRNLEVFAALVVVAVAAAVAAFVVVAADSLLLVLSSIPDSLQ